MGGWEGDGKREKKQRIQYQYKIHNIVHSVNNSYPWQALSDLHP